MEQNQNKSIYTVQEAIQANIFSRIGTARVYTDFTWVEDMATQGCDRSADSAAGMMGRRKPPFGQHSGAKAVNPRGLGTESPSK
jgi:hypothetical protein